MEPTNLKERQGKRWRVSSGGKRQGPRRTSVRWTEQKNKNEVVSEIRVPEVSNFQGLPSEL